MKEQEKIEIPLFEGHNCFACGTVNPIGLGLHFYRFGHAVCTDITLDKDYEGWKNMAHGGILSTLMDEVMSWTILYFKRVFFVTRKMDIKYLKPVLIGMPLTVKGQLKGGSDQKKINVEAEIFDDKHNLLTKGAGEFVVLTKEQLSAVPESMKADMLSLFERMPEI